MSRRFDQRRERAMQDPEFAAGYAEQDNAITHIHGSRPPRPPLPPPLHVETDGTMWTVRHVGDQAEYNAAYGEDDAPLLSYWRGADLRVVMEDVQRTYIEDEWHTLPKRPALFPWRVLYHTLDHLDNAAHWLLLKLPPYGERQGILDYYYTTHLDPFGGLITYIPERMRSLFERMTQHPWRSFTSGSILHMASHIQQEHMEQQQRSQPVTDAGLSLVEQDGDV